MKVLFIGGTGLISIACSELALQRGMDLTILNRSASTRLSLLTKELTRLKTNPRHCY